jgi:hypothetical protein
VSNIHIHNNTINGPAVPWVYVMDTLGGHRHDRRVNENVVLATLGSPVALLYFVRVDDVEVRNNVSHAAVEQSRKAVEFWEPAGGRWWRGTTSREPVPRSWPTLPPPP